MSHRCVIPNEGEERNRYSHVNSHENLTHHVPMSNHEVAELTWKNGQLSKHELGGIFPAAPTKLTWSRTGDTLESIVHQATCTKRNLNLMQHGQNMENIGSVASSSGGKWPEYLGQDHFTPGSVKKRTRSSMADDEGTVRSACASTDARFCRDNDSTLITWASFDSTRSTKTKTADDDSACHDGSETQEEERGTKSESGRSHSTRRGRAATIHNQSERRRRDRINQKMKDLQKLVPHASKTDKASMLDEVIEYLKLLQAQVHLMSAGNMPHIMMPLAMQHHLHMSLLARMGMGLGLGMGMGMLDMSSFARLAPQKLAPLIHPIQASTTASPFVPPPFVVPHMVQQASCDPGNSSAAPMPDPYSAYLAQVKNMNLFFS